MLIILISSTLWLLLGLGKNYAISTVVYIRLERLCKMDYNCTQSTRHLKVVNGIIPLRAKQVGEFIEIRHKKISPIRILSTLCEKMTHI